MPCSEKQIGAKKERKMIWSELGLAASGLGQCKVKGGMLPLASLKSTVRRMVFGHQRCDKSQELKVTRK